MTQALQDTRKALFTAFGNSIDKDPAEAKRLIERHTHLPEDDVGGWSPSAAVVIHAENIPLPGPGEVPATDLWCVASALIPGHFIEHINNGVAAVYEG